MPTTAPPPYVTALPSTPPPPPYTPYSSIIPSTIFYPLCLTPHPVSAPTYTILCLPQTVHVQYPVSSPQPQMIYLPALSAVSLLPTFRTPPPFPPFPPGAVPPWVPRQIRYELIRGVWTPVEHFAPHLTAQSSSASRGWNTLHGWDNGPLPPGVGTKAGTSNLPNFAGSLRHAAVSKRGGSGGSGNGSENRIVSTGGREIGHEIIEVGARVGISEAEVATRQVPFGEEGGQVDKTSGLLRAERASDARARGIADVATTSSPPPIPPNRAPPILPSTSTSSTAAGLSLYESENGIGDRITHRQMERNLNGIEGLGAVGNRSVSVDRFTEGRLRRRDMSVVRGA